MARLGTALVAAAIAQGTMVMGQNVNWKEMAEMPRPVAGYMAGVTSGKLVVAGGSYWKDKQKHWTDLVQVFDPKANTWHVATPLPKPRSDAACATLDGDIYIFGGGAEGEVRSDALVLHAGNWMALPAANLPKPRLYAAAVSFGGDIYVLGGLSKAGDYRSVTNTFWRWRSNLKIWESLPALPGPGRVNHAMTEIDGMIYVFGGATTGAEDVTNLNDAYEYNPVNKKWARLRDLVVANRAWWAVGLEHHVLLLGGYTDDFASSVYLYDKQHGLREIGKLPHGLADTKFYRIGDVIVGAGGEAGAGVRGRWTLEAEIHRSWLSQAK